MFFAGTIAKFAPSISKRNPSSTGSLLFTLQQNETSSTSGDKIYNRDSSTDLSKSKVNSLVRNAVSQALSHFGGPSVAESLLYILELEHSVDTQNILDDLQALHLGLQLMFGNASYVVEEHMRASLAKSLGLDPEGRSIDQLIDEATRQIVDQESIQL